MSIKENVTRVLEELPAGVLLMAAAKTRLPREVLEAVEAGVTIIGENYVQEAEKARQEIGQGVKWHLIGHLQKNKVRKAVEIFDMIETVDSTALAGEIDKRCSRLGRVMPILIEVNSGRESQKRGVFPEQVEGLAREITAYSSIRLMGLMTMGPATGDPEDCRPYFLETRKLFEQVGRLELPGAEMKYLSMGMTNSYRVAIEEGANLVRLGSEIFGNRE
ncbi:MAG: YggS family pyridoxal phosphate-dependent enzyme [Dehalococcoidales bacterium]